jgi:hypothetical protein
MRLAHTFAHGDAFTSQYYLTHFEVSLCGFYEVYFTTSLSLLHCHGNRSSLEQVKAAITPGRPFGTYCLIRYFHLFSLPPLRLLYDSRHKVNGSMHRRISTSITRQLSNRHVIKTFSPISRRHLEKSSLENHNAISFQESVMLLQSQTPRVVRNCQMDLQPLRVLLL